MFRRSIPLKNKNVTIDSNGDNDDMCFKYEVTAALNHRNIEKIPQRITKIRPYINQYE